MAKKMISLLLVLLCIASVHANECVTNETMLDDIVFDISFNDPTWGQGGHPKSPITPPSVSLDDHTLYSLAATTSSTARSTCRKYF